MIYKILLLIFLFTIVSKAVEIVQSSTAAERYLKADLVIVGEVISIETMHVEKIELKNDWYETTDSELYKTRIDSLLKGNYNDSLIFINSQTFSNPTLTKFSHIDENGDSVNVAKSSIPNGYKGSASFVRKLGKYILLLIKDKEKYISILCCSYNKDNIYFFKEVEEKGMNFEFPSKFNP